MLIYIAGRYSGATIQERDANIRAAAEVAMRWWDAGHTVICPHTNAAGFEEHVRLTHQAWYDRTLNLLRRCDGIALVPNWENSVGARTELDYARRHNLFVFMPDDEIPGLHPTEERCPIQCQRYLETVMGMYRLHLKKNRDYSPANLLGTGDVGVAVRLWDKVARYLNLIGFKLTIEKGEFEAVKEPNFESIEDTLIDLGSYAVIARLLRSNEWGK